MSSGIWISMCFLVLLGSPALPVSVAVLVTVASRTSWRRVEVLGLLMTTSTPLVFLLLPSSAPVVVVVVVAVVVFVGVVSYLLVSAGQSTSSSQDSKLVKTSPDEASANVGETARAELLEGGVDELRDAVEGLDPVLVAAAEDGVRDVLERRRGLVLALEPGDEVAGVVGGLALVGGRDDDDGLVGGQAAVGAVEAVDLCRAEAVRRGVRGDTLGQGLAGAAVGAVEDRQRLAGLGGGGGGGGGLIRLGLLRGLLGLGEAGETTLEAGGGQAVAQDGAHVHVLGLDGEGLLDAEAVVGVEDEVEVLEQHGHDEQGLLPGKGAADAGAHAVAKGLPAVGELLGDAVEVVVHHALRLELVGVLAEDGRVEVGLGQQVDDGLALLDGILAGEQGVLKGLDGEERDGGVDAQGLAQDAVEVGQLGEVVDLDLALADDAVDLLLGLLVGVRVLEQLVKGKGQQARGGLVAGDEEGDEVVHDALVRHLLARLGVDALEHGRQQVAAVAGLAGLPRLEHLARGAAQDLDVAGELLVLGAVDERGQRQAADMLPASTRKSPMASMKGCRTGE
ncbi:hypothetical protein ColKHC_03435 [Colletotrichum higginsianum]|nr:hypothetical protein ColKHC_03435 [Colletotrichum higginsianum]